MTQEEAAAALFISTRALQNYESGQTPVPKQIRLLMAKLYNAPQLIVNQDSPAQVGMMLLDGIRKLQRMEDTIMDVTADDDISGDERQDFVPVQEIARGLSLICNSIAGM